MKARIIAHTPIGAFYSKTNDNASIEELSELADHIKLADSYMTFETVEGNTVILMSDTVKNSVFVLENLDY